MLAGYAIGHAIEGIRGDLGVELGGGFTTQHADGGGRFTSPVVAAAPWLGLGAELSPWLSLRAEVRLSASWLKRDNAIGIAWLPAAYLGLALRL